MQKENDKNFNVIVILLSVLMVLSVIAKFSFSISVQTAVFIFVFLSSIVLINKYKFKIDFYIIPAAFLISISAISYIGADFQTNVRDNIIVLLSSVLAGFNVTFLSSDSKKKMFVVPVFIGLWLAMVLFSRFITNPQSFFSGDVFFEAIALNINIIAGFLVLIYPLLFLHIKEKPTAKIYVAMAVFILAAILLTKSRIAIFSSFIITLIFLFEYRQKKYIKIAIIIICAVLISSLAYVTTLKINFNSLSERFVWWQTAYIIFKQNILFGCGFGNYCVLFKVFRPELVLNTVYVHNIFMQLLADIGISGVVSFIWLLTAFYRKVLHEIKNNSDRYYYKVIFISVTFFLIVNLVDYSFFAPANMMMFFIIFCSVFSAEAVKLKKLRVNAYLLTAFFLTVSFFAARPVVANIFYRKGIDLYVSKRYLQSLDCFFKAVKFDNKNPEYYYQLSNASFAIFDQNRQDGRKYLDDAIKFNKQALDFHKYSGQLMESLSYLYWNNNDKENALKYIKQALEYDRFNPYIEQTYQQLKNS